MGDDAGDVLAVSTTVVVEATIAEIGLQITTLGTIDRNFLPHFLFYRLSTPSNEYSFANGRTNWPSDAVYLAKIAHVDFSNCHRAKCSFPVRRGLKFGFI